jgi:hypothetical protein
MTTLAAWEAEESAMEHDKTNQPGRDSHAGSDVGRSSINQPSGSSGQSAEGGKRLHNRRLFTDDLDEIKKRISALEAAVSELCGHLAYDLQSVEEVEGDNVVHS